MVKVWSSGRPVDPSERVGKGAFDGWDHILDGFEAGKAAEAEARKAGVDPGDLEIVLGENESVFVGDLDEALRVAAREEDNPKSYRADDHKNPENQRMARRAKADQREAIEDAQREMRWVRMERYVEEFDFRPVPNISLRAEGKSLPISAWGQARAKELIAQFLGERPSALEGSKQHSPEAIRNYTLAFATLVGDLGARAFEELLRLGEIRADQRPTSSDITAAFLNEKDKVSPLGPDGYPKSASASPRELGGPRRITQQFADFIRGLGLDEGLNRLWGIHASGMEYAPGHSPVDFGKGGNVRLRKQVARTLERDSSRRRANRRGRSSRLPTSRDSSEQRVLDVLLHGAKPSREERPKTVSTTTTTGPTSDQPVSAPPSPVGEVERATSGQDDSAKGPEGEGAQVERFRRRWGRSQR